MSRPRHTLVTLGVWRPGPRPRPRAPPPHTGEVRVRLRPLGDLYRDVTGDVRGGRAVEIVTLVHLAHRIQVTDFKAFEMFTVQVRKLGLFVTLHPPLT